MGRVADRIASDVADFIALQHVFFVATVPTCGDGHVSLSPKDLDTFAVVDANLPGARTAVRVAVGWAERRGPDDIEAHRAEKNAETIDGLPGLPGVA